jgi:hypothetical protein
MNFDHFLSESIEKNNIKKNTGASGITVSSITGQRGSKVDPTIKKVYNQLNSMINQKSTPFFGDYVIIPPTLLKSKWEDKFVVIDIKKANAALWRIYNSVMEDGAKHEGIYNSMYDSLFDRLFRSPDIIAASLNVGKNTIKGFPKGYRVYSSNVDTKHQGQGLMLELYKKIVESGIPLISDNSQSPGAIKTWEKLFHTSGIKMVGVDHRGNHIPLVMTPAGLGFFKLIHQNDFVDNEVSNLVAYKE